MSDPKPFPAALNHPCYLQIPAHSLRRCATFYQTVFSLHLINPDSLDSTADRATVHFDFPGSSIRWGGITKLPGSTEADTLMGGRERAFATVYFHVEDVGAKMEVIQKAGGTLMMEKVALQEGKSGTICEFRDTEGNFFGIYTPPPPESFEMK